MKQKKLTSWPRSAPVPSRGSGLTSRGNSEATSGNGNSSFTMAADSSHTSPDIITAAPLPTTAEIHDIFGAGLLVGKYVPSSLPDTSDLDHILDDMALSRRSPDVNSSSVTLNQPIKPASGDTALSDIPELPVPSDDDVEMTSPPDLLITKVRDVRRRDEVVTPSHAVADRGRDDSRNAKRSGTRHSPSQAKISDNHRQWGDSRTSYQHGGQSAGHNGGSRRQFPDSQMAYPPFTSDETSVSTTRPVKKYRGAGHQSEESSRVDSNPGRGYDHHRPRVMTGHSSNHGRSSPGNRAGSGQRSNEHDELRSVLAIGLAEKVGNLVADALLDDVLVCTPQQLAQASKAHFMAAAKTWCENGWVRRH